MIMMRSFWRVALGAASPVLLAAAITGCGGGSSSSTATPAVAGALTGFALGTPVASTICSSGSTSSGQLTLAAGFALQLAPMAFCGASIAFQSGTTVSGTITVASGATVPITGPGSPPTTANGATVTPIMFETLAFPPGAAVTVPAGSLSPSIALSLASVGTCTSFYETIGGAPTNPTTTLTTWQPFGLAATASATFVSFNSSASSSTITLGSAAATTTYFIYFACT
jgi:hypothetical protein